MSKHTTAKRLPLVCLCLGIGVLASLLAGCGKGAGGNHELSASDFKHQTPPPEALKGMEEARKHAGPPSNAGPPAPK